MPEPPASDRDLDETTALAAVREQLPALGCRAAAHLGSGWECDVYVLDDRYVARFPRNADAAGWVDMEQAILGLVADSLASAFSVPRVVGRGGPGAHFPYDFLVCEYVPGVRADWLPESVCDRLAMDLGRALTRIHSVSPDAAREAGVPPADDGYAGTRRFLHGDFSGDNIVADPASGRLVGVIDWSNAVVGDPAQDFTWLVLWRGWRFTHAALGAYELPVDDDFLERLRFHAQLRALEWATDSIRRRADPELHLMWLRNAFSLVSAP